MTWGQEQQQQQVQGVNRSVIATSHSIIRIGAMCILYSVVYKNPTYYRVGNAKSSYIPAAGWRNI